MKPIKTPEQHAEALSRVDRLMSRSEHLSEKQQDELEVLSVLIETYERETHAVSPPTALEAIRFRMMQTGYRQKDLAALVGGPSRASEILNEKRELTPEMMRRLRDEWGIPADSLLGGRVPQPPSLGSTLASPARDPKQYPMKQMYDRKYFAGTSGDWKSDRRDQPGLLDRLLNACSPQPTLAYNRQGGGSKAKINPYALEAWRQRVIVRAAEEKQLPAWNREALDDRFLRWMVGLSCLAEGPQLAREELAKKGVQVIIEARLDETHLDGAALLTAEGRPVIGLTLRHNRLDNFWFTLFHEIGHVLRHLSPETPVLFDSEIDQKKTGKIELEADRFALDTLIPPAVWSEMRHLQSADEIRAAADKHQLGAAIIAGRLRREANDYRKHPTLIGNRKARAAFGFTEITWPK
ncbi:MAG: ImmA/IrrE family metallo-endopeptidase [Akkermansiaceae bacterium]